MRLNKTLIIGFMCLISIGFFQCEQVSRNTEQFIGTQLREKFGDDFELIDQNGELVSNSRHGEKTAILTFLFASCTDVCPLVTSQIKSTLSGFKDLENTPVFIITVDPDRDDRQTRLEFIDKWGLPANWHFLSGEADLLSDIWNSYHVNPQNSHFNPQERLQSSLETKYKVIHTAPIYLLDNEGRPTVLHTSPINSDNLRSDLYTMMSK